MLKKQMKSKQSADFKNKALKSIKAPKTIRAIDREFFVDLYNMHAEV